MSASPSAHGRVLASRMLEIAADLAPLPGWLTRHPISLTSPAARQTLWMRGRQLTRNQDLGFTFAERMRLDDSLLTWKLHRVAPTIRASFDSFQQWSGLVLEFSEVSYVEAGDELWLRTLPPLGLALDRAEQDFRVGMIVKMWRAQLHRPLLMPLQVHFTYPRPSSLRAHRSLLGASALSFGQPRLQLCMPRALFDAPLPDHDPGEFARLHATACAAAALPNGESTSSRADASLTSLLALHSASARAVAVQLGLSVRTLRRRLSEEGKSFQQLLDQVRRRELELHAEAGSYPVGRLARLVGFSSDRALRHALRRWGDGVSSRARRRARFEQIGRV